MTKIIYKVCKPRMTKLGQGVEVRLNFIYICIYEEPFANKYVYVYVQVILLNFTIGFFCKTILNGIRIIVYN